MSCDGQPGRARRSQRAAGSPDRQLARPHRPHLRQRPAEARHRRPAGHPSGGCVSAGRPQQLRVGDRTRHRRARAARGRSRRGRRPCRSRCCTRPGTRRDRSACTSRRTGCCWRVTCSSPAPSAAPTCRAVTTRPWSQSLRQAGTRPARRGAGAARPRSGNDDRSASGPGWSASPRPGGCWSPADPPTHRSSIRHSRRC